MLLSVFLPGPKIIPFDDVFMTPKTHPSFHMTALIYAQFVLLICLTAGKQTKAAKIEDVKKTPDKAQVLTNSLLKVEKKTVKKQVVESSDEEDESDDEVGCVRFKVGC